MEKLPKGRAGEEKMFLKMFFPFCFQSKKTILALLSTFREKNQCAAAVSHILSLNIGNQQNVKDICCKSMNNTYLHCLQKNHNVI